MNYAQNSDLERHFFFFLRGYDQLKAIEDVDVFTVLSDFLHVWTKTRWDVSLRDVPPHPSVSSTRRKLSFLFFLRRIAEAVRSTCLISASLTRWRQKTWHHTGHLTSSHPANTNPDSLVCIGQHVASGGHQRREVNLYALSEINQLPYGRRV